MKKVCHVTSAHHPEDGRIFQKECVSLARAGYDVHLVEQGETYDKGGVHIVGFGQQEPSRILRMIKGARRAYNVARGLDCELYHLHDPELLRFALRLKREGHRVVFDSHEDYYEQIKVKPYIPKPLRHLAASCYRRYESHVFKRIDGVIAPATSEGVDALEGRANAHCYVDNLPILGDPIVAPSFEREKRDTICYAGSLTHDRGITHLIKAAYVAGVKVILCGNIEESYLRELQAMPEFEMVEYRGMLDKQGVASVCRESFCGAAALLNVGQYWKGDNLPTKVYEYLLEGIPFIYSLAQFGERFVEKVPCCLRVDPEDIDSYAEAIAYLRDNPDAARQMAECGYQAVIERYNWNYEAGKLIDFYQELN